MKKFKKFLSVLCAVCMILSCAAPSFAMDTSLVDDGTRLPTPRASQVVVEQSISSLGASWTQPFGNNSYKIWVDNTTDELMTITHTSGFITRIYELEANMSDVVDVVNDAIPFAAHYLDFSTQSGTLSGRVTVRVADVDQYYS